MLGDLGGVTEVLMLIFGFFMFPISEHSFYVHAAKLLYFAKTEDSELFTNVEKDKKGKGKYLDPAKFPKDLSKEEIDDAKKNRAITLSSYDNFMLFVSRLLGMFFCECCWDKRKKLERMYDEVEERITKELDVVRLLKKVNNQNAAMKASLLEPDLKFQINHAYKNVIDLDKESSDEDEEAKEVGDNPVTKVSPLGDQKLSKSQSKKTSDDAKLKARVRKTLDG